MGLEIRFAPDWDEGNRNRGRATKGNIQDLIEDARLLPNAGGLRVARVVYVEAGVHRSPAAVHAPGRRPGGGLQRGAVGDWHWHVTIRLDSRRTDSWHVNVVQGRRGLWEPINLFKRPGQRHFEQESPGRFVSG